MDPILFSILLDRAFKGVTDVDTYNLVIYFLDSMLHQGLKKKLRLMTRDRNAVKMYETLYTVMSVVDVINWLRGRPIGIDSIPSFVYAYTLWYLKKVF